MKDFSIIKQLNISINDVNLGRNIRRVFFYENINDLLLISAIVVSSNAGGNFASSALSSYKSGNSIVLEWNQTSLSGNKIIGIKLSYQFDTNITLKEITLD